MIKELNKYKEDYGWFSPEIQEKIIIDYKATNDIETLTLDLIKHSAFIISKHANSWKTYYGLEDAISICIVQIVEKTVPKWIESDFSYYWPNLLFYHLRAVFHKPNIQRKNDLLVKYNYDEFSLEGSDREAAYLQIPSDCSLDGLYESTNKNPDMPVAVIDVLKDVMTETEFNFIYDIYWTGKTMVQSGIDNLNSNNRMTSSNIHRKILKRVKSEVKARLQIEDITELIELTF